MSVADPSAESSASSPSSQRASVSSLSQVLADKGVGPAQWMEVGNHLKLDYTKLKAIEFANPRAPERCLMDVLNWWIENQETYPTLNDFESAMRGFNPVLRKIYATAFVFAVFAIILFLCCQPQPTCTSMPQPLLRYVKNLRAHYRSQRNVTGIEALWYDKDSIKFIPPVFHKLDLAKDGQPTSESEELYFDDFFRYTGLGQRILVQARPGSGKTTLANRLTKEWANQKENTKITECPILLRVKLRELRSSDESLSLSDILRYSLNDDIEYIDEKLAQYLSEPENATCLCIIFDGLDEYPPAYNDPSNYIYKIINGQKLFTATVIVFSRPEAYATSGEKGCPVYELTGFNTKGITEYVTTNIPDQEHAKRFLSYLDEKPLIHKLCTAPLHLTMFVESYKIKYKIPSTLTEAYFTSLSKAIKVENKRKNISGDCSDIDLEDFSSLRECSRLLADTILNVSRLAYEISFVPSNESVFGYNPGMQFSHATLQKHLPSGESLGSLSRYCRIVDNVKQVCMYSFPHKIIQSFWAVFYVKVTKLELTYYQKVNVLPHTDLLCFVCGMHSSYNNALLLDMFRIVLSVVKKSTPHKLYFYTMCGLESGRSIDTLVDMYLEYYGTSFTLDDSLPSSPHMQHSFVGSLQLRIKHKSISLDGTTLVVGDVLPSSPHTQIQTFLSSLHLKIKHIVVHLNAPSFRLYFENCCTDSDVFPNLEIFSIEAKRDMPKTREEFFSDWKWKCSFDFNDNLRLIAGRKKHLKLTLPLEILIDQSFFDCLDKRLDIEMADMSLALTGSVVKIPYGSDIHKICKDHWKSMNVDYIEITPDVLWNAIEKFTDKFSKLSWLHVILRMPISYGFECQHMLLFFKTQSRKVQRFTITDSCTGIYVEFILRIEDFYTEVILKGALEIGLYQKVQTFQVLAVHTYIYSRSTRRYQSHINMDVNSKLCNTRWIHTLLF